MIDFAVFGCIANGVDFHNAGAVDNGRTAKHSVGGVGLLADGVVLQKMRLFGGVFSGEAAFVDE